MAGAYFDTLARIPRLKQDYFTEPRRIVTFYRALRGRDLSPSPTLGIYRMAAGLYLLATRLQLDPDGRPHIPGGLEVWKNILQESRQNHHIREWARRSRDWKEPDQLIEAMFAFSRMYQKDSPLRVYWSLSEMDRRRPTDQHLSPQLVHLLARNFPRYGDQYTILTEWSSLDEKSITRFIEVAQSVDNIRDTALRANAIGIFQANVGLWEILARQDEIRHLSLNESWQQMIQPFFDVKSSERLVDAARASLSVLFTASTGGSRVSQEGLIALLAAPVPSSNARQRMRQMLADRMRSVMDAQELASLDTIFALADGLSDMAKGKDVPTEALLRRANELRQFETPKPILSNRERSALALGGLSSPHAVLQSRADFSHLFKQPAGPPVELAKARGLLAPFLRDTLVGLNYAYYEPPGSQVLHTNPLFVRLHDFGMQLGTAKSTAWEEPHLVDRGGTPIGGAHLEGSLAGLPFVLASVEEEFLVPDDIQALIWEDMVPNLLTGAVLPRWWRVTREEIHAAALYQRFGEELLAAAAEDAPLRQTLLDILSERMHPTMLDHLSRALSAAQLPEVWPQLIPTDTFFLGAEFLRRLPDEASHRGSAGTELGALLKRAPQVTSLERISRDFGIPHPALADTYACELLDIKPLPSFLGYSARLLAESWESNNLYWARLADEKGYDPVLLHVLVPALTQRMVEKISGTHLEDWPSIMRALHETGEEFRAGKINFQEETGSNLEPRESHVIPR